MDTKTWLSRRCLVAVSGPDARTFLQGLVTVDVARLAPGQLRYAALLSPQGKFLHDFFLLAEEDRILIDVEKSRRQELIGRLTRYRLRAQVEIEAVEDMAVFASQDKGLPDPRFAPLGFRFYGPLEPGMAPGDDAYDALRLQHGVPVSADFIVDRSLIVECGFEALRGVDFDKGCYVGQEVTARTKFKSVLRKQFYRVEGDGPLPACGTKVMQGEKEAGELRTSQGHIGIAMLYNESVSGALTCNGAPIRAALPAWSKIAGEANKTGV